jgi:hypothetical protein
MEKRDRSDGSRCRAAIASAVSGAGTRGSGSSATTNQSRPLSLVPACRNPVRGPSASSRRCSTRGARAGRTAAVVASSSRTSAGSAAPTGCRTATRVRTCATSRPTIFAHVDPLLPYGASRWQGAQRTRILPAECSRRPFHSADAMLSTLTRPTYASAATTRSFGVTRRCGLDENLHFDDRVGV